MESEPWIQKSGREILVWTCFFAGDYPAAEQTITEFKEMYPGWDNIAIVEYRLIRETAGLESALEFGNQLLEQEINEPTENALNLLLGNMDLRDITFNYVFELTNYMIALQDYEFSNLDV